MAKVSNMDLPPYKHKVIVTLFSYPTRLDQVEQHKTVDAIFPVAKTSKLIIRWRHTMAHITALFDNPSPPSLR